MRKIIFCFVSILVLISCRTKTPPPVQQNNTRQEYIRRFAPLAVAEMERTGVPASIKLAQAILESGDGNSRLARLANNHFGIKCHEWKGPRIYHDDDQRGECFRKYRSPEYSFRDHSDFLRNRRRYAFLFDLDPTDYRAWATGLQNAGYATNPDYDRLLIRIIEENQLYRFDIRGAVASTKNRGKEQAGQSLPASEPWVISTRNHIKYIVAREGDTFESLTNGLGLMTWELPRYNEISGGRPLLAGTVVYLQPKRNRAEKGNEIHIVQEGETLYYISQLYGVKMERLRLMNKMQQGEEPKPGSRVWLRQHKPRDVNESNTTAIEFEP